MLTFKDTTTIEIHNIIKNSCHKTSPLDPFPNQVLINCIGIMSTAISQLINLSFHEGHFPESHKIAQILPLLKKPNLDTLSPLNYRPISNLSTISKIIERSVLKRLQPHISSNPNYSSHQSAYRQGHSTETALLQVLDHAFNACNSRKTTILACLDLSAAFDTISHTILIDRLQSKFGIAGNALSWINSYLSGRSQFVKLGKHSSSITPLRHGVPQGSVLGPLLFTTYISPITEIIKHFNIDYHQYADDTQIFHSLNYETSSTSINTLTSCIKSIESWFLQNYLQLNASKTETILLGTSQQLSTLNAITSININNNPIPIQTTVKTLGVYIDNKLTFSSHITSIIQSCNYHLRAIKHIRPFITSDLAATLARCMVLSRLDYCNSVLHNITQYETTRLQRVMNRAARITLNITTPLHHLHQSSANNLIKLHWLPIPHRIIFKIATITFKLLTTSSPSYLQDLISVYSTQRQLRSSKAPLLNQQTTVNNIARRAFRHAAPSVWNSLPPDLRNNTILSSFKKQLKTHLFTLAFPFN